MRRRQPIAEPDESTPLSHMLTPADYVSVMNAVLGLLAIFLISLDHVEWAVMAILAAVIGDGADGAVARLGYGGGPFGGKLDSFADLVAFAVAPATLLFHVYYQWEIVTQVRGPNFLTALAFGAAAALFFACGVLRLVRFEVLKGSNRSDFFVGLSIPAAAVLVTVATYIGASSRVALGITAFAALLMVSRFRYPKIRGALVAPSVVALLGAIVFASRWDAAMPKLLFSMMAVYAVMGPLFVRWRAARAEAIDSAYHA